jgi:hypothetical protein
MNQQQLYGENEEDMCIEGVSRCSRCCNLISHPTITLIMRTSEGTTSFMEFCSDDCFADWMEDIVKINRSLNY